MDVGGIRDVLAGEHLPQHLHDLCLGLVVRLLLNTPRLLVGHGDKEDVGTRILLLKLLSRSYIVAKCSVFVHISI